jgi:hypothetical protein
MTIAFVQGNQQATNNSGSVRSLAFSSNVTAGNFLIIVVSAFTGSALAVTVTDNLGNFYEPLTLFDTGPSAYIKIFFCADCGGGPCTVRVTPSAACYMGLGIHEYSGISDISWIDSWCDQYTNVPSTNASGGIPPIPRNGDMLFAAYTQPAGIINGFPGTGFTLRTNLNNSSTAMSLFTQDMFNVNSDTDTPFTFASPVSSVGVAIALRAAYTPTSQIKAVPGQATGTQVIDFTTLPVTVSFPNPTTPGDFLVASVATWNNAGNPLPNTIEDNYNNNWLLASAQASATTGQRIELWYVINASGGNVHQITVTPPNSVRIAVAINEYTGPAVAGLTHVNQGNDANPNSGPITAPANALVIGAMTSAATPGIAAPYQHSIGIEQNWTNAVTLVGDAVTKTVSVSMEALGDVVDQPSQMANATWRFADTQFWTSVGSVFLVNAPTQCVFLSNDELSSLQSAGFTVVGGPFTDQLTCLINCGFSPASSSSIVSSVFPSSSVLSSASSKSSSSTRSSSSIVSVAPSSVISSSSSLLSSPSSSSSAGSIPPSSGGPPPSSGGPISSGKSSGSQPPQSSGQSSSIPPIPPSSIPSQPSSSVTSPPSSSVLSPPSSSVPSSLSSLISSIFSSSSKLSVSSAAAASSAKSSAKSSTLASSKSSRSGGGFSQPSVSSSGSIGLAPACVDSDCQGDPHYNNDPTLGPIGIVWPAVLYLTVTYTPDATCPYVQSGQVIPLYFLPNYINRFGGLGAWASNVITSTGGITQLNAAVLSSQLYGDFGRAGPNNCPAIRFQVTCTNGFAPNLFLWIYWADESQEFDFASPQAWLNYTSCYPLQTSVQWQPTADMWSLATFNLYQ